MLAAFHACTHGCSKSGCVRNKENHMSFSFTVAKESARGVWLCGLLGRWRSCALPTRRRAVRLARMLAAFHACTHGCSKSGCVRNKENHMSFPFTVAKESARGVWLCGLLGRWRSCALPTRRRAVRLARMLAAFHACTHGCSKSGCVRNKENRMPFSFTVAKESARGVWLCGLLGRGGLARSRPGGVP